MLVLHPSYPSIATATAIVRTDDQVARQNALSHAMGALFLESRVQDLEQSVERARRGHHYQQQQQQQRQGGSLRIRQHGPTTRNAVVGGSARTSPAASSILSAPSSSSWSVKGKDRSQSASTSASTATSTASLGYARGIRVVDVSVLIYSLRSVHTWLRAGQLALIVPYGALHTLDLLKTGKDTINHAARKALCFLEQRLTDGSPFVSATDDELASSSTPKQRTRRRCRPGLFFQRAEEGWSDVQLEELRVRREAQEELEALISELGSSSAPPPPLPPAYEDDDDDGEIILVGMNAGEPTSEAQSAPDSAVQGWHDLSSKGTTPRHIAEVLSCGLWVRDEAQRIYFEPFSKGSGTINPQDQDVFALAVAYPPPALCDPLAHELGDLDTSGVSMADLIYGLARSSAAASPSTCSHNHRLTTDGNGNGNRRRQQQLGHASLADGLLTHRWALSFGLASRSSGKGADGGAGADADEVPLWVQVLPTAASWLDLGERSEGAGSGGGGGGGA
ncbi:unnamed protein product [Tilletia controversa]|uniref:PIN domain-containing protein n=3 Tax=Tilletia TaxID=13289 RepID=A0A8X7MY22_9BASI|nr:hypothetical protein CF328_g6481 [Tilletia controversa]KAE8199167.1 hypothetical protein CF336_g1332 [Tilletia laevis]KAE8260585.1 hypothetical protein A4X03_0g3771 [Tilletia caries]KAE8208241.1 hypothetical protein CF335_g557 [Tilletia laevis]KAE8253295.1 hypothetical protein A4X06_0g1568 [Tilletia controversa]